MQKKKKKKKEKQETIYSEAQKWVGGCSLKDLILQTWFWSAHFTECKWYTAWQTGSTRMKMLR